MYKEPSLSLVYCMKRRFPLWFVIAAVLVSLYMLRSNWITYEEGTLNEIHLYPWSLSGPHHSIKPGHHPNLQHGTHTNSTIDKVIHIRFLKVHKAGSTTMQNLLFRFGIRYGLNIVLNTQNGVFLREKQIMPLPPGEQYHIFALHTIYTKQRFENIIPDKDSVNIGIVRYPPDRLISAAFYHRDVWHVKYLSNIPKDNYIHDLIMHPNRYDASKFSQTKNTMGQEFGFPSTIRAADHTKINKYLRHLDKEFKLVLVVERFDESLVLMKRLLHWDIVDILYLKANSHTHNSVSLNRTEIDMTRKTCFLDWALYDYFTAVFEKKVAEQGKDFKEEVEHFKQLVSNVSSFCEEEMGGSVMIRKSKWHADFVFKADECQLMKMPELKFLIHLKERFVRMHKV